MSDSSTSDTEQKECHIPRCTNSPTRELHFPSLGAWKPYCDEHTPVKHHDKERDINE